MRSISTRKAALWKLGFRCFSAADHIDPALPDDKLDKALAAVLNEYEDDELRYATLEFQLYTRWSPYLGNMNGSVLESSDPAIRQILDQLIGQYPDHAEPTGIWEPAQLWEDCLDAWEKGKYCCPVQIERLIGVTSKADESSNLESYAADRAHVWTVTTDDVTATGHPAKYFSVRDVSGWFPIDGNDPAYKVDPAGTANPYAPPTGVADPAWLAHRRIFMLVVSKPGSTLFGPSTRPWHAAEFRPKVLGGDMAKIAGDVRWSRIFRIVRAVSEQESIGYFDVLQAYDNAILSMPLFHYAAPPPKGTTQLGGLAVWFDRQPSPAARHQRFSTLGLHAATGVVWEDARNLDSRYETGSGERIAGSQSIVALLEPPVGDTEAPVEIYRKNLAILQRPHFVYRFTMHLRTVAATREALWHYAVHFLRQIAWLRIPPLANVPAEWQNQPLGQVVQSERNLALILRIAVKNPAWILTNVKGLPGVRVAATAKSRILQNGQPVTVTQPALLAWLLKARELSGGDPATFEATLGRLLTGKTDLTPGGPRIPALADVNNVTLNNIYSWPKSMHAAHHLDARELHPSLRTPGGDIVALSEVPGSSPFLEGQDPTWRFSDSAFAWYHEEQGHPPPANAPFHPEPPWLKKTAAGMGIAPVPPAGDWPPQALEKASTAQTVREILAMGAMPNVLDGQGNPTPNPHPHDLPVHGSADLRWSRLVWHGFWRRKSVSALLCGPDPAHPPGPADACWRLDAEDFAGKIIHAFDARSGAVLAAQPIGTSVSKAVRSAGDTLDATDPGTFGLPGGALVDKTLSLFKVAVSADGIPPAVDGFDIALGKQRAEITLGWLRQSIELTRSKSGKTAPASDLGMFFELLGWRTRNAPAGISQRYLRTAGLAFLNRKHDDRFFDFSVRQDLQPWSVRLGMGLWTREGRREPCTSIQAALLLMTWPALHRWRDLLRHDEAARRVMLDVWRIGLREALRLPVLQTVFGKDAQVFRLFQSEAALKVIACWAWSDGASLNVTLRSKAFREAIAGWIGGTRNDYKTWKAEEEAEVLWEKLVPSLRDAALRKRLLGMKPGVLPADRPYVDALDQQIYLDGLEGTEWPGAGAAGTVTSFMVAPDGTARFGVAMLTRALPGAAPPAGAPTALTAGGTAPGSYLVTGIAPYADTGASGAQGAAIELDTPIEVKISTRGTSGALRLFGPAGSDPQDLRPDIADVQSDFSLEADVSSWFGAFGQGVKVTLLLASMHTNGTWELQAGFRVVAPWLRAPFEYPLRRLVAVNDIVFDLMQRRLTWSGKFEDTIALLDALPFRARGTTSLSVGLDAKDSPVATLSATLDSVEMQLGTPIASLGLQASGGRALTLEADLTADDTTLRLALPDSLDATLRLELASAANGMTRVVPLTCQRANADLLPPLVIRLGTIAVPANDREIAFRSVVPLIPLSLFQGGGDWLSAANVDFSFLDVARNWFGDCDLGLYLRMLNDTKIVHVASPAGVTLKLPLQFEFNGGGGALMTASAELEASCAVKNGMPDLSASSFSCGVASVALTFTMSAAGRKLSLGSAATLYLPDRLDATLDLTGTAEATVAFTNLSTQPVTLQLPSDDGFKFDLRALALGPGGATLDATVRSGETDLPNLPTLSSSLSVRPADATSGRLVIERGRLVSASLSADARLRFFDDAEGVLTLELFQHKNASNGYELGALARFEVPVDRTYNVRALYLQVSVQSINLSLTYFAGSWNATGGMTGSLAFVPAGPLAGRLAEYQSLFDGTSVHFENLDLHNLGNASLTVSVTPRTFDVAGIFQVTLRGFTIDKIGEMSLKSVRLLGDATFKVRLPGLRTELTLGDIRLSQPDTSTMIPKIKVSTLGVAIELPTGFRFKGRLTEYDEAWEYGFGGSAYLESEAFPGTTVTLKLTRLKTLDDAAWTPSFVAYADVDREDQLAYGFFLRKLGIGVGGDQGLIGFSDAGSIDKPVAQKVQGALDKGIPYPGAPESWTGIRPPKAGVMRYSLVGFAQVSFGLLPRPTEHLLVTTLVLSIDDRLDIIAGINGWILVSLDDALKEEFVQRPVLRGAIGFSPREQVLYGRFMTMQNPKFGEQTEKQVVSKLIRDALEACRLSVSFYCSPQGSLLEIGYPRQARYSVQLGPARGRAEAGFRIGYYRGTQVIGLNLAVNAEVSTGVSGDFGFANVELHARAAFMLQGSFAGAVTSRGEIYTLADLTVSALFEISARVYKEISGDTFLGHYSFTLFDLSGSLSVTATAAVRAALVPAGLGFSGTAEVAVDVCGFQFGARLDISVDGQRVDEARRQIDALVPPLDEILKPPAVRSLEQPAVSPASERTTGGTPQLAAATGLKALASRPRPLKWCYHVRKVGDRTRIVLYPDPGADSVGYPPLPLGPDGKPAPPARHTIVFKERVGKRFSGLVGRSALNWNGTTLTYDEPHAEEVWDGIPMAYVLKSVETRAAVVPVEIVDPRTHAPVAGDFDDPAVLADPQRRSTRFRKRTNGFASGDPLYDDYLAQAQATGAAQVGDAAAITNAELLAALLGLAEDRDVKAGGDQPLKVDHGNGLEANPRRLAGLLGLVLEFEGHEVADLLAESGMAAIADQVTLFDTPLAFADWQDPTGADASFTFESDLSYWYQGQGEVGLTWQLTRWVRGIPNRKGPGSHLGVRYFEVERMPLDGQLNAQTFRVRPAWVVLRDQGTAYYIRPQFQFVDTGLPTDRDLALRYTVRAIGADGVGGPGENILCEEVFDLVYYQPVRDQPAVVNAQAVLRTPRGDTASVDVLVAVELPPELATLPPADLAARLELLTRPVPAGRIGTYGAGNDSDISLRWQEQLSGSDLRLPEPVQSRRQGTSGMADASMVAITAADWEPLTVQDEERGAKVIVLRAQRKFMKGSEAATWELLGVAAGAGAELYVRLGQLVRADTVEPATPYLRCRLGLTSDPQLLPAMDNKSGGGKPDPDNIALESLFTQGREVAALERFDINSPQRKREWAPNDTWAARPHIEDDPAKLTDLGWNGHGMPPIRLAGTLQHHAGRRDAETERFGPPVAYRIWSVDRLDHPDAKKAAPMRVLRSFAVQPEQVFRALPERIVPRTLPGADGADEKTPSDWRYATPGPADDYAGTVTVAPRASPLPAPAGPARDFFGKVTCDGGAEALVHVSIRAVLRDHEDLAISIEEILGPAPGGDAVPDRAAQLLARASEDVDHYGWRLLEGLGASGTVWMEKDDTRVPPDDWPALGDAVWLIRFRRMAPVDRIEQPVVYQYGARILAHDLVELLANMHGEGFDIRKWLEETLAPDNWTALHHALHWLTPVAAGASAVPDSWVALVTEAARRCSRFVQLDAVTPASRICAMWQNAVPGGAIGSTPEAGHEAGRSAATVLPAVEGMVEFAHLLAEGYASHLALAVEVVRRYDLYEPDEAVDLRGMADQYVRDVEIPRTLALALDHAAMTVDGRDGSIKAVVQVHPAQRAHLYQPALMHRCGFAQQCVQLQRKPSVDALDLASLFRTTPIDWSMYQDSWGEADPQAPTLDWSASIPVKPAPDEDVARNTVVLRYPLLPPVYEWNVAVTTQAGVRASDDGESGPDAVAPAKPMFVADDGSDGVLAYRKLEFGWRLDGTDLMVALPFARAIDALPLPIRGYWSAIDDDLPSDTTGGAPPVPVLQTPDLDATYFVVAFDRSANVNVDLLRLVPRPFHTGDGGLQSPPFLAELLVSPYGTAGLAASYAQLAEGFDGTAMHGRLGMVCTLPLRSPELAWLAAALSAGDGKWRLRCDILRDGIRYPIEEVQ
jgi:hypothetical protein